MGFANVNLYVVRQGFTHKEAFVNNIAHLDQKNIPHVCIVINDVKAKGLQYDYGYEYTYYADDIRKPWYKSLTNVFLKKKSRRSSKK